MEEIWNLAGTRRDNSLDSEVTDDLIKFKRHLF